MTFTRLIRAKLLLLALVVGAALAPGQAGAIDVCGELARVAERREGLPLGLVQAVALAESGRWLQKLRRSRAWPWTVRSVDETYYLSSKEAALAKVRELKARGRTNIDVGCMQVNLGYHGHAFGSLEQALEPAANVAYAAGFLKRLRAETRSWALATAHYHSRDRDRGEAYRAKVYRLWQRIGEDLPLEPETVQVAGEDDGAERRQDGRVLRFGSSGLPNRSQAPIAVLRGR